MLLIRFLPPTMYTSVAVVCAPYVIKFATQVIAFE